jgi:hypothetical protein
MGQSSPVKCCNDESTTVVTIEPWLLWRKRLKERESDDTVVSL